MYLIKKDLVNLLIENEYNIYYNRGNKVGNVNTDKQFYKIIISTRYYSINAIVIALSLKDKISTQFPTLFVKDINDNDNIINNIIEIEKKILNLYLFSQNKQQFSVIFTLKNILKNGCIKISKDKKNSLSNSKHCDYKNKTLCQSVLLKIYGIIEYNNCVSLSFNLFYSEPI